MYDIRDFCYKSLCGALTFLKHSTLFAGQIGTSQLLSYLINYHIIVFLSRRNFISTRLQVLPDWCRSCPSFVVVPRLWKLCNGITSVILELHFWDLVHCLLISFCFGSEILKKIRPPEPPKKRLMDFHDGISCQCFGLEG